MLFLNLPKTTRILMLLLLGSSQASAQLIWSDEFNDGSVPDENTWSYDLGRGNNGWGNRELQEYTNDPRNVRVEDGDLVITARPLKVGTSTTSFTSGRIKTENKLMFKYATIEARIKIPDLVEGLWPAFWTLGNNFSNVGWPACGELDVMEMGASSALSQDRGNQVVYSTAHWDNAGSYASYGQSLFSGETLNDDYHVFRMEWTPDLITTYLDGQRVWAIDISESSCASCSEFHQPHFAILNLAVGGQFPDRLQISQITADLPAEMRVDYVRIFNNGFTEVSGSGLENSSIIGPRHSGSFYNKEQSGHGFSMEFGQTGNGTPQALIYWYTYDADGNPLFLVGQGQPDQSRVELSFVAPTGMVFGAFDPDSVERPVAGTGVLDFADPDNAIFNYTPSDYAIENLGHSAISDLPLSKIFGIPAYPTFQPPES